jgi:hypothetical protein
MMGPAGCATCCGAGALAVTQLPHSAHSIAPESAASAPFRNQDSKWWPSAQSKPENDDRRLLGIRELAAAVCMLYGPAATHITLVERFVMG